LQTKTFERLGNLKYDTTRQTELLRTFDSAQIFPICEVCQRIFPPKEIKGNIASHFEGKGHKENKALHASGQFGAFAAHLLPSEAFHAHAVRAVAYSGVPAFQANQLFWALRGMRIPNEGIDMYTLLDKYLPGEVNSTLSEIKERLKGRRFCLLHDGCQDCGECISVLIVQSRTSSFALPVLVKEGGTPLMGSCSFNELTQKVTRIIIREN